MITEQFLLKKWQSLDSLKQAQVLAFIDQLNENSKQNIEELKHNEPKTELGKKLKNLRQEILKKSDVKLLDWNDIEIEMNEIRSK